MQEWEGLNISRRSEVRSGDAVKWEGLKGDAVVGGATQFVMQWSGRGSKVSGCSRVGGAQKSVMQ